MSKKEESIKIMKRLVIDVFILIVLGLCLHVTDKLWIPYQRGFFCGDESLMYPYITDTVTILMLRLMGLLLPIFTFLLCEWSILRKDNTIQYCLGVPIPTWVRGFYCTLASFSFGICYTELAVNITKATIGRFRPHFFDICQPSVNCSLPEMVGKYIQPHDYTCTGPQTNLYVDMNKSFLSGHSAWAAYSMIYLALYLESRLRWCGSHSLRHTLQFSAVMLSWYCALSRISDYKHHWSDVLAGYTLGFIFAVVVWLWGTDIVQKEKNTTTLPQCDAPVSMSQSISIKCEEH